MPDRQLPSIPQVEKSVIGSCLLSTDNAYCAIEAGLTADDFYVAANRQCWKAIVDCLDKGNAVDMGLVTNYLKMRGIYELIGGESYLVELVTDVATTVHLLPLVNVLKDYAARRKIIKACSVLSQECYEPSEEKNIVDFAQAIISSATENNASEAAKMLSEIIPDTMARIEAYFNPSQQTSVVKTGFIDVDKLTGGLYPGDLIIIAGRPSMGKSSYALSIACNVAKHGKRTIIFSPEMTAHQIVERAIAMEARVDLGRMRAGTLPKSDLAKISIAASSISSLPIIIDQTGGITTQQIRSKIMRNKPDLAIIDYLQLLTGADEKDSREQQLSTISLAVKTTAKQLGIPIILVSQLNREVEKRRPPIPLLSDLHGSGAIEQNADTVFLIYRPEYYGIQSDDFGTTSGRADVIIAKQRNGPTGYASLSWSGNCTRFDNRTTETT